jgi:hypothetical protein
MTNKIANHFRLLSDEKKEVIATRMDLCLGCPYNSQNAKLSEEYFKLTGEHYNSARPELHCSLCGCIIEVKTSSLSSDCGIVDWNEENPKKQLAPKWLKYE